MESNSDIKSNMLKQYSITDSSAFNDADKKYRIHPKDKNTVKKYQK